MADHTPNNPNPHAQQPTQLPEGLSEAARVRAIADGEMTADTQPIDSQSLAFEQGLRQAVARAMQDPQQAPAGLREQIMARFDAEFAGTPIPIQSGVAEPKQSRSANSGPMASLLTGFLPRFAAVAAVLLLSASAIFFAAQQLGTNRAAPSAQTLNIQTVSSQLQFVQREHNRCSDITTGNFTSKIEATDPADAKAYAEARLGCGGARLADAIERMAGSGYRFIGVGACAVPGGGKSVHALFAPEDTSGQLQPVSIFLLESPGEGCKDTKPGVCYSCPKASEKGTPSMLWRDDALIVFVHSASEQSVDIARSAYLAPDKVESL